MNREPLVYSYEGDIRVLLPRVSAVCDFVDEMSELMLLDLLLDGDVLGICK